MCDNQPRLYPPWDQVVLYIRHIQLIFKSRIIDIIVHKILIQTIGNVYEIMSSPLSSKHRVKSRLLNCGWIWSCAASQSFGADTASRVLNNKSMDLTGNVAKLIILIPNEGHESPEMPEEQRLINQPYVPQNIVVNTGTNVVWFNGDVDHDHKITLVDENSNPVFESGEFKFNTLSKPLLLNDTGKFSYSESDVSQDDPKFVMEGTITTVYNNISQSGKAETNSSNGNYDTVTLLMVRQRMSKSMFPIYKIKD